MSSGEGLIWAVRDEIRTKQPVKEKRRIVEYQEVITDHGVEDKRLLVVESELASTLRVLGRDGNTLSAIIRCAWDTGNLRTLTKNSPATSTDAHISIIGHITKDELVRYLGTTEAGNGFANRFLWLCVRRSKLLPDGGRSDLDELRFFGQRLSEAIRKARTLTRIHRDQPAKELWHAAYEPLSEPKSGLFGAVVSRSEAQVTRLACVYALLNMSTVVEVAHLQAALEVWRYAEDSARYIFGDTLGDPVADEILRSLRSSPEGLTRNDIRELFKRNKSAQQVASALSSLRRQGLARCEREDGTGGRPAERWIAIRGYAVNAINAVRGSAKGRYRVNSVNGVAHSDDSPPSSDRERFEI